jgi:phage baseplate assembly protein W
MDLVGFDDLDQFGSETQSALEELAQDLYHRLIETRGSNLDDPDRGLGIEDMLSGPYDPGLTQRIEAELRKDDRVDAVQATITELGDDGAFRIEIEVEANGETVGLALEPDGLGGFRRVA